MPPLSLPTLAEILLDPRRRVWLWSLGALLVALPAAFCALLPFVDLISFAAIHSYPAIQSYGPDHYYVFQFTYILPHILSRAMADFGLPVGFQVWALHCAEVAGVSLAILLLLAEQVRARSLYLLGALLGAVAFIDGMHVWGGPFAFTCTEIPFGLTLWILFRSLRTGEAPPLAPLLSLSLVGLLAHPYVGPWLVGLYVLYLLLRGPGRARLLLAAAFVAAYLLLISRDSPEAPAAAAYRNAFALSELFTNVKNFFIWNDIASNYLAGAHGPLLSALFALVEAVKLLSLAALPFVLAEIRARRELIFLYVISTVTWAAYLVAAQPDVMSYWPQRLLVMGAVPMFAGGVIAADLLFTRYAWPPFQRLEANRRALFIAAGALAAFLAAAQWPLHGASRELLDLFTRTRAAILATGAHDAVIDAPLRDGLRPIVFYAVPYLLFSDPAIVARKLTVYTNWHTWPRHNTRIPEMQRPTGQPRYRLLFDAPDPARPRHYEPRFSLAAPAGPAPVRFSLHLTLPAGDPPAGPGDPLVTTGVPLDANFVYLERLPGAAARVCLDRWGLPGSCSPPFPAAPGRALDLTIALTPQSLEVSGDGLPPWRVEGPTKSLANPVPCANPVGGTSARPHFTGSCQPR